MRPDPNRLRAARGPWPARLAGLLALAAALAPAPAPAAPVRGSEALSRKLDPELVPWAESGGAPRTLWVSFADKSPPGSPALEQRLARAEEDLTPRARARRLRARVRPLVDVLDLPVATPYLASLEALGLRPFAVSRWLNRAAVRVEPAGLAELAALPHVAALSPVRARAARPAEPGPVGPEVTVGPVSSRAPGAGPPRLLGPGAGSGLAAGQLAQIGAEALHAAGFTGAGVLIVIMDQGFNFHWKHDALRDRVFPPGYLRDFVDGDTTVADTTDLFNFRHGTWILGALGADLPGVYRGSAPGATFALARSEVGATETPEEMLYWAQAAEWADSLGADLIASAVGYNDFDPIGPSPGDLGPGDLDGGTSEVSRAARAAAARGILLVNSVGNGGFGPLPRIAAPADVNGDSLIAVGAVDTFGTVSGFSSRGPTSDGRIKPDLVARGTAAWLVNADGLPSAYERRDGTSFAAPLVAGLAACLMEARPGLSAVDVIRALRETASAMCVPDLDRGWGIPDGPAARGWTPGPPGVTRPPQGHLELVGVGPNPARGADAPARFRFGLGPRLGERADARLRVFDAQGRLVRNLFYGSLTCGRWQAVEWNGRDHDGRMARPGVYLVRFDAEGRTRSLRVALLE